MDSSRRGTRGQLPSPEAASPSAAAASSRDVARAIMSSFSELDTDDDLQDKQDHYQPGERRRIKTSDDTTGRPSTGYGRQMPIQKQRRPVSGLEEQMVRSASAGSGTVGTDRTQKARNTSNSTAGTNLTSAMTGSSDGSLDRSGAAVPSSLVSPGIKLSDSQKRILMLRQQRQREGSGTNRGAGPAAARGAVATGATRLPQDREQAVAAIAGDMKARRIRNSLRGKQPQPQQSRRPTSRPRPTQQRQSSGETSSPPGPIQPEGEDKQVGFNKVAKVREFAPSMVEDEASPNDPTMNDRSGELDPEEGLEVQDAPHAVEPAAMGDSAVETRVQNAQEEETRPNIVKRKSSSHSSDSAGINSGGDRQDTAEVNVTEARVYVGRDMSTQLSVASSITESYAVGSITRDPPADSLEAISVASSLARRANSSKRDLGGRQEDIAGKGSNDASRASSSEAESLNRAQVEEWLAQQCLERYSQKFFREGYDSLGRIKHLDMSELERMEILPGHRRSLMHAVGSLRRQGGGRRENLPQISEEPVPETTDSNSPVASRRSLSTARQSLRNDEDRLQRRIASMKSKRRGMMTRESKRTVSTNVRKAAVTKKVRFSTAEVRTYKRMYSDNPSVSGGPPVGIGWRYNPRLTHRFSVAQHKRSEKYNHGYCPTLSREEREQCLLDAGFSDKDIAQFTREAIKIKNQRRTTVQNASFGPTADIEEKIENIGRAIKKVIRPEKNLLHKNTAA